MSAPLAEVDAASALRMIDDDLATLLDVREDDEWAAGHAPRAVHVPLGRLDPSAYSPERTLVTVCRSGARSGKAAVLLAAAGLRVHNLAGGMNAWQRAGQPVVRDADTRGTDI